MSLSFTITHQNIPKKVTCKSTANVSQLVAFALEKFKLPATASGTLAHNGKKLDGFTPLRLTGLVNNAKLTLTASQSAFEATLKFVGSVHGTPISTIIKANSDTKLAEVVSQIFQKHGFDISLDSDIVELSVMRQAVRSSHPEFATMTVASLAGSSPNAVVRINVENKKNLQEREERRNRAIEELPPIRKSDVKPTIPSVSETGPISNGYGEENMQDDEDSETSNKQNLHNDINLRSTNGTGPESGSESQHVSRDQNFPVHKGSESESSKNEHFTTSPLPEYETKTEITPAKPQGWNLPVSKQDTLYVPSAAPAVYENPDEDYELTSNQAEKYYKILKSMQGRPAKKVAKLPSKYTIRIRFPDRALLDLHFADPATKLGQLLKKIDTYLLEVHVNSYTLKNGMPPFEEVQFGFGANGTPLHEHPLFQQEKILLIWESQNSTRGPYLKSNLPRKDVSELPTVLLDSHRGDLESDNEAAKKANFGSSSSQNQQSGASASSKPRPKGMPKWFRP